MKTKVSCLIPAYNEEKTIAGIIKTCLATPQIAEVIVINDGSQDQTLAKLKPFGRQIKVINLSQNQGKGFAIAQGVKKARYPLLLLLDADLIGWKPHHLQSLIQPVAANQADMTIGNLVSFKIPHNIWWPLSGQRCLRRKDIRPLIKELEKTNYGLEILLNERLKKKRIIVVPLVFKQKFHLGKESKQKDWLSSYIKEIWEVFQQTISMKSSKYQQKMKKEFLQRFASYLKMSYSRLKNYLLEEEN